MSLYNDVRPRKFSEVIGNTAVVKSMITYCRDVHPSKRPHTFLFQGPAGCGKTTLARLLAKGFGCRVSDSLCFRELNMADTRGVETAREVIEEAALQPLSGGCRVFLFDECHQLTSDAQNALLKVTEDAPDHAYFFFCSTEPNKVIKTIRSRCTVYQVRLLTAAEMKTLLDATLVKVGFKVERKLLAKINEISGGAPREALTILEKVISVTHDKDRWELLDDVAMEAATIDICRAMINNSTWVQVAKLYKALKDSQGSDAESVRRAILGYLRNTMLGSPDKLTLASRCESLIGIFESSTFTGGDATLVRMLFRATTSRRNDGR